MAERGGYVAIFSTIGGAILAGGVALLFAGANRGVENQSDTLYQLPAFVSRLEANEERINNVRRDITIINDKLVGSPTVNEISVEVDAIRRRLEELLVDVRTIQSDTKELARDVARTQAQLEKDRK